MRKILLIVSAVATALPIAMAVPVSAEARTMTLLQCMNTMESTGMPRWWAYKWCIENGYTQYH